MRYKNKEWTVEYLLDLIKTDRINLSPHYQRNDVWPVSAQKQLIDTIKKHWPLPSFFVRKYSDNKYEMVDGQQRSRAIKAFNEGVIADSNGIHVMKGDGFGSFVLDVCEIEDVAVDAQIEEFYTLVNSTGLHLNRPELHKAKYYNTELLRLATELAQSPPVVDLNLFAKSTVTRMNDVDFITELIGLIAFGISDKKLKVDELFEKDITQNDAKVFKSKFIQTVNVFCAFDKIKQLRTTRYRQKADFYSLFYLFSQLLDKKIDESIMSQIYRILCILGRHISPSLDDCEPLKEYAINCVTQSNGRSAREARNRILREILLNNNSFPNETQTAILDYFGMCNDNIINVGPFYTFDIDALSDADEAI